MLDSVKLWQQALSDDQMDRQHAARDLWDDDCEQSTDILQHLISDPRSGVRLTAVYAIERHHFDGCVPLLVRMMHEDPNFVVRSGCTRSLAFIPNGAAYVVEALDDADHRVISSTIANLQASRAAWASDRIADCLTHTSWEVRYSAACALLKFGIGSQQLVDTIQELMEISEAQERVHDLAFSSAVDAAMENLHHQYDGLTDDLDVNGRLEILRDKHGSELVPFPQEDPLGDMLNQAQQLFTQE